MYIYESHLGGLYINKNRIDRGLLYCDTCGNSDWEIGNFKSAIDFLKIYANNIDCGGDDNNGGYSINYVLETIKKDFKDTPSEEEAVKIVKYNRQYNNS